MIIGSVLESLRNAPDGFYFLLCWLMLPSVALAVLLTRLLAPQRAKAGIYVGTAITLVFGLVFVFGFITDPTPGSSADKMSSAWLIAGLVAGGLLLTCALNKILPGFLVFCRYVGRHTQSAMRKILYRR